ncbi:hypothetical protein SARC_01378 [Sphaeroforma arctica JP610]|uniref:OBG-type G domain-containing protein n=1 Tax=Sphaeroforma arctica JP610 TaxID=667725 RepID=A0A0L0GDX2_9EUKA|nr:hypothetical protein SARC_01378 [Sphaeroforma arctica JP610]KNC86468.1 hypothetical protein SARC_01378 [Sphaeroforma arctica JP610]|eukprot:XP_014160370.1 hypothetical protein SARC_01378 [Sphaeroforma arctica JP610]
MRAMSTHSTTDNSVPKRRRGYADTARLYVRSGSGGMGGASYGGTGGDGGGIILRAKRCGMPLVKRVQAENGGNSSRKGGVRGVSAKDVVVDIPVGTVVSIEQEAGDGAVGIVGGNTAEESTGVGKNSGKMHLLDECIRDDGSKGFDMDKEGQTLMVAKGGRGGSIQTQDYNPERGVRRVIKLELKSIADIGLVGFPNAGKSTLLTLMSDAKPAIGSYPFTTLRPQIGVVHYDNNLDGGTILETGTSVSSGDLGQQANTDNPSTAHTQYTTVQLPRSPIKIADIPGIIEGASENVGMGHKFLRHIERTKGLVFVVDVNGFSLNVDDTHRSAAVCLEQLVNELARYSDGMLLTKPCIIVVNKIDTLEYSDKLASAIPDTSVDPDETHFKTSMFEKLPHINEEMSDIDSSATSGDVTTNTGDELRLKELYEDIRELSTGAGLLVHSIVPLSAHTGLGRDRLKRALRAICEDTSGDDWDNEN